MPHNPKKEKGYTLLELVVVMALIGLFLTLSVPRFRQAILTNPLHSSTRKLVGIVKNLRSKTVRQSLDYSLHFEFSEKLIWWAPSNATLETIEKARENGLRLPEDISLVDVWTGKSGKESQGSAFIYFTKRGYAEQSMIHLSADDGEEFSIEISPFLDKVEIHESYIDPEGEM